MKSLFPLLFLHNTTKRLSRKQTWSLISLIVVDSVIDRSMPLPQKWNKKKRQPPDGFDYVEPVLEALENELRDKVKESNLLQRKTESVWPVHQINWQKTRYIYDLYNTHNRISKEVYQYCLDQKLVDASLIAKWKKPGYERLCSTYVINPNNYKFGTTSICRVPWKDRSEDQRHVRDPTVRCFFSPCSLSHS